MDVGMTLLHFLEVRRVFLYLLEEAPGNSVIPYL